MKKFLIGIITLVVLVIAWWLISPLFLNTTVDEEFAFEFGDIQLTAEQMEQMSPEEARELQEQTMQEAAEMPDTMMDEEMPIMLESVPHDNISPAPTPEVRRGIFRDGDATHKASGGALLIMTEDQKILRLENLDVTNGPDLRVLLSTSENPTSRDTLGEYIELDRLKGNRGNQNYEIDMNVDLSKYKSVVIYCKPFHVVFGFAALSQQSL